MVLAGLCIAYRPLMFASVDPDGAEARGVSVPGVSVLLLVLVALAEAVQVVGVLLVLTLVITPAASAVQLTARPVLAMVWSVAIALCSTEGGILLSLWKPYPTSFFIATLSFAAYVVARIVRSRSGSCRSGADPRRRGGVGRLRRPEMAGPGVASPRPLPRECARKKSACWPAG